MKQKQIKIQDVTLPINLGVNYFYKYFFEMTGVDLIANPKLEGAEGVKMFEYAAAFIAAGYKAECKITKTDELHTKDDIEHMINSMDLLDASKIVIELVNLMNGGDPNPNAPKKGPKLTKAA
jgi:hypothetical protein